MTALRNLAFDNTFSALSDELFSRLQPQPLSNPHLVSANPLAAELIDLDFSELQSQEFIDTLTGLSPHPGFDPLAMVYGGHQFGSYNPQLGDGRGLLLGEVLSPQHGKWDLHLKGAGTTPYSRFGDGRAVLRSSIREYLCSEAMAGLGIPTTRALCIIGSDTPVQRETSETAAMLLRLAKSHIRFGHFEYFHYNQRADLVKLLADHVIDQHYPELLDEQDKNLALLQTVVTSTAELIAHWQAAGFAHGVLNTDNMSIIGDTFDYGPYGFLDDYEPGFICNHSDHQGRYAFNRQPSIGLWNLNALAHALSSLIETDGLGDALSQYEPTLITHYDTLMHAKFGFQESQADDSTLFSDYLSLMAREKADYTLSFRQLSYYQSGVVNNTLRDHFVDREAFDSWALRYQQRLNSERSQDDDRQQRMCQSNPKYILRNYLAQQAIDNATQQQDYSGIDQLLTLLQSPYNEHPNFEHFAKPPPDWGKKLAISCSS